MSNLFSKNKIKLCAFYEELWNSRGTWTNKTVFKLCAEAKYLFMRPFLVSYFCLFVCFIVRQDPLLGGSEMFNGFLRKAQQVGNAVSFRLDMHWVNMVQSKDTSCAPKFEKTTVFVSPLVSVTFVNKVVIIYYSYSRLLWWCVVAWPLICSCSWLGVPYYVWLSCRNMWSNLDMKPNTNMTKGNLLINWIRFSKKKSFLFILSVSWS